MNIDQYPHPSSEIRFSRMSELTRNDPPYTLEDILILESDTSHSDYPIYRDGAPPDDLATAALGKEAIQSISSVGIRIFLVVWLLMINARTLKYPIGMDEVRSPYGYSLSR